MRFTTGVVYFWTLSSAAGNQIHQSYEGLRIALRNAFHCTSRNKHIALENTPMPESVLTQKSYLEIPRLTLKQQTLNSNKRKKSSSFCNRGRGLVGKFQVMIVQILS